MYFFCSSRNTHHTFAKKTTHELAFIARASSDVVMWWCMASLRVHRQQKPMASKIEERIISSALGVMDSHAYHNFFSLSLSLSPCLVWYLFVCMRESHTRFFRCTYTKRRRRDAQHRVRKHLRSRCCAKLRCSHSVGPRASALVVFVWGRDIYIDIYISCVFIGWCDIH